MRKTRVKNKKPTVEQQINTVLVHQDQRLAETHFPPKEQIDKSIIATEELLQSLGVQLPAKSASLVPCERSTIVVPSWEELCAEAEREVGAGHSIEELFTEEELKENQIAVRQLNDEFNAIHRMDAIDVTISAAAAILGGVVDILLVGIPQKTPDGLKAGPLSNYVRDWFNKRFPEEEMEKLANSKVSKVSFDAQDNRHTTEYVKGLSAYYHRLLSLGHDPVLGLIFGVYDILNGTMTTLDKEGKFVIQVMENYADRKESDIFAAIAKQIIHFKSDITTSMGLPAPLMSLFNLLQFGKIGEEELTIAEIVQGMYYEGYDFIHFCSMSIPTMIIEVVVRLAYAIKRIKEGHSVKESIPVSLNREKHPKLATMLFTAHSGATAINAGKVYFTENPMAINYPQWIAFAKYSYKQLKWSLFEKPELRDHYVRGKINEELAEIYADVDKSLIAISDRYDVVFSPDQEIS